jgi:hypothetical protein
MDILWIYDNSSIDASQPLVLGARKSEVRFLADDAPNWLTTTLGYPDRAAHIRPPRGR